MNEMNNPLQPSPEGVNKALGDEITSLLARIAHLEDMIDMIKTDARLLAVDIVMRDQDRLTGY